VNGMRWGWSTRKILIWFVEWRGELRHSTTLENLRRVRERWGGALLVESDHAFVGTEDRS
jgi:hypothetical protein